MKKLVTKLILISLLVMGMTVPAAAYTLPNADIPGSLTITMKIDGEAVAGGKITIYKTGEIDARARSYMFVPTEEFKDSGIPLTDIESAEVAGKLAEYAKENSIAGISKSIGKSGEVCFENLTPGLYMVVQDAAAEGYAVAKPFQVAVPEMGENGLDYNPQAFPKVLLISWGDGSEYDEDLKDSEKEDGSEDSAEESETEYDEYLEGDASLNDDEKSGDSKKLPQTGQLKWPVPALTVLGLVMFAFGWYIRYSGRKGSYEK